MGRVLRIGLVQYSVRHRDPVQNLRDVLDIVSTASGLDILAINENWLGRRAYIDMREYIDYSSEVLASSDTEIFVAGSAYVREGERVFSRTVIIDRGGSLAEGGKVFPSHATGERERVSPSTGPAVYTREDLSIASIVCVDIMYPEIVRRLALRGVEIVFNPSIIPSNRKYLWRSVGSARASENTIYIVHINATNTVYIDGRRVDGGSFIADPYGYIVFEADDREGLFVSEIDLGVIGLVRSRWRYLDDIRELLESSGRGGSRF